MTSRERLLAALDHREPDRVPFDMGSTAVSGIHQMGYVALRAALNLPKRDPIIWHQSQQLAFVEEDVHQALQTDMRGVRPKAPSSWSLRLSDDGEYRYYADEFGIVRRQSMADPRYFDLYRAPLRHAETVRDIEWHPWPSTTDPVRFEGMREAAEAVRASGSAVVLGGATMGMMEMGQNLRGYEDFYMDLAANPALVEAIADRVLALKMGYWQAALARIGDLVDFVQEGDDYGGQHGLLLRLATWRRIYKPRLAQLVACIKKAAPHVKVGMHSCGAIRSIIPDYIEIGIDAVNPIQVSADGMDTRQLKQEFGASITLWGGAVDTQHVLPFGTPQQVRDEVRRRLDDMAPGGGYICTAVHNIQADVPPANIIALREAALEFGAGG